MLRVGIIGSWHVHTDGYLKELQESGKVTITAVWDQSPEWADKNGLRYISDYDAFLSCPDIEAVVCNAPTTMHGELLMKAALSGKHIFTEKLLSQDAEECKRICKVIDEKGITFTISLPLRCTSHMLYAKQAVETGLLGRISAARMRRSHSGVSDGWLPEYWFDTGMTGGGAWMDLGAHPAYILSFLFGRPIRISGMTSNLFGTSSDENAIALAEFDGGILGTCETAFVTCGVPDILEIYGSDGWLSIRGGLVELNTKSEKTVLSRSDLPEEKPTPIIQFVNACIAGTGSPEHLGTSDAQLLTDIITDAYISDRLTAEAGN